MKSTRRLNILQADLSFWKWKKIKLNWKHNFELCHLIFLDSIHLYESATKNFQKSRSCHETDKALDESYHKPCLQVYVCSHCYSKSDFTILCSIYSIEKPWNCLFNNRYYRAWNNYFLRFFLRSLRLSKGKTFSVTHAGFARVFSFCWTIPARV